MKEYAGATSGNKRRKKAEDFLDNKSSKKIIGRTCMKKIDSLTHLWIIIKTDLKIEIA